MKRLLFVSFITLLLAVNVLSNERRFSSELPRAANALRADLDADFSQSQKSTIIKTTSAVDAPGTIVGETAYNYQTNGMLHDRIIWDPETNAIHVSWIYGDLAESNLNFPNRFMYYNFFDGNAWQHGKGIPIESGKKRYGYGSLEVIGENKAISISHSSSGMSAWYDFMAGFGFFTESRIWDVSNQPPEINPTWPDIAIDRNGKWHAIASAYNKGGSGEIVNGILYNILYWNSSDEGATWSSFYPMVQTKNDFPMMPYNDDTGNKNLDIEKGIEASDTDDKIAVVYVNYGHDLIVWESDNAGVSWNDPFAVMNNTPIVDTDSITVPPMYDIIVRYDSMNTDIALDTLISAWLSDPGIASRPTRDADILYIDGELHAVWVDHYVTPPDPSSLSHYPYGLFTFWNTPQYKAISGDTMHYESGYWVKHWSPSTGVSVIDKIDEYPNAWGASALLFANPQIGVDQSGNLYCIYSKVSSSDTLRPEDGIEPTDADRPALSFYKIWGAKSSDGGKTWFAPAQLTSEEDFYHRDLRFASLSDINPDDGLHILFQDSPVPGTAIVEDHNTWANIDMRYWKCPTSLFPDTPKTFGPEIELVTNMKMSVLDFGYVGDAGETTIDFTVKNIGDADLTVGPVFTGHKAISVSPNEFVVPPGGEQKVTVTFKTLQDDGTAPVDTIDTYIAILNNDLSENSNGLPVRGIGVPDYAVVGVASKGVSLPQAYALQQNYPNPFNPSTSIQFSLVSTGHVKLAVYNTVGEEVAVLIDKDMTAGSHTIEWRPQNLSSGVYFYRLTAGSFTNTKKMILMQ